MTDRELLELAAKAAGHSELIYCEFWKCMARELSDNYGRYFDSNGCWNPLTSDRDALRLAVSLGMKILLDPYGDTGVTVEVGELREFSVYEPSSSDPYATTRRAIVRAAAEIGKVIQQPKLEDVPEDNYRKTQA